jgi:hypothetical protein
MPRRGVEHIDQNGCTHPNHAHKSIIERRELVPRKRSTAKKESTITPPPAHHFFLLCKLFWNWSLACREEPDCLAFPPQWGGLRLV